MGNNLGARLRRIRENRPTPPESLPPLSIKKSGQSLEENFLDGSSGLTGHGWSGAGFQVLQRQVRTDLALEVPPSFVRALAIIVPDFFRYGRIPHPTDLVFFDLETTGLSRGAGTAAFLGSFGRFEIEPGGQGRLVTHQYLLLDYPGESDFLEALKAELSQGGPGGGPPFIVTYNGKTFDSQIFKNRCLMNAMAAPDYFLVDLLHPARRLWKRTLPDCSQLSIETGVLGLDRTGDTPGSLAPEIWFTFLKFGDPSALMGVCDHNLRDIAGLASLCLLLGNIAASPLEAHRRFKFDLEALALLWRETLLRRAQYGGLEKIVFGETEKALGDLLLKEAAERCLPRCLYALGQDLVKAGQGTRGKGLFLTLALSPEAPAELRAAAFRVLAVDAEWRGLDSNGTRRALGFTEAALALKGIKPGMKEELEHRRNRLLAKVKRGEK